LKQQEYESGTEETRQQKQAFGRETETGTENGIGNPATENGIGNPETRQATFPMLLLF